MVFLFLNYPIKCMNLNTIINDFLYESQFDYLLEDRSFIHIPEFTKNGLLYHPDDTVSIIDSARQKHDPRLLGSYNSKAAITELGEHLLYRDFTHWNQYSDNIDEIEALNNLHYLHNNAHKLNMFTWNKHIKLANEEEKDDDAVFYFSNKLKNKDGSTHPVVKHVIHNINKLSNIGFNTTATGAHLLDHILNLKNKHGEKAFNKLTVDDIHNSYNKENKLIDDISPEIKDSENKANIETQDILKKQKPHIYLRYDPETLWYHGTNRLNDNPHEQFTFRPLDLQHNNPARDTNFSGPHFASTIHTARNYMGNTPSSGVMIYRIKAKTPVIPRIHPKYLEDPESYNVDNTSFSSGGALGDFAIKRGFVSDEGSTFKSKSREMIKAASRLWKVRTPEGQQPDVIGYNFAQNDNFDPGMAAIPRRRSQLTWLGTIPANRL